VMSMRAHSTAVQDSLKDYRFGSANDVQIPSHRLSDSQVEMDMKSVHNSREQRLQTSLSEVVLVEVLYMMPSVRDGAAL